MRWIAMLALVCAWIPLESGAATNRLRIGVPWSPGSKGMNDLQAAGRDIAKNTAGRVSLKFVEQHDLDTGPIPCAGALLAGPALARESPVSRIFALPLFFRSSAEVGQVRAQMDATVAAELEAHGWATLAQLDLGFAHLHSQPPVQTVAQLKAAKLWIPPADPEAMRLAESYGMTRVPLEASQVREALRQGAVDAAIVPPLGAILLQWHTEIKNVVEEPFACLYAAVVIRKGAWEALEGPDQAVLRDELARVFSAAASELRQKEPEALDVLALNGVARVPLGATPGQKDEWEAWAIAVADRFVADGLLSADVLAQARQILAGFRAAP